MHHVDNTAMVALLGAAVSTLLVTQPIASLPDCCEHSYNRQYEPHCLLVTGSGYTHSIAFTLPTEHIASMCGASAYTSWHLQGDTPMSDELRL